jgi:7,8-dihydroneopterin aldolase/epimerase/oxygenase
VSTYSPFDIRKFNIFMFTINLHNLIFHSFHGVHDEERILGNTFEVNVSVTFEPDQQVTTLEDTINYATIYEIIKQRMSMPTHLLETLVQEMTQEVYDFDNRIKSIAISVEKKNPPISNMEGSVSVHYKKPFN